MVSSKRWITWKNLDVLGQIIFCEICKAIRYPDLVVADVTTLNFNLMFEIGFAIRLGLTAGADELESFGYIQFFLVMCGPGVDVGPTDPNCSFSLHRYDPGC